MEYIENSELERIASILSNYTMGNYILNTRFEAFSSTYRKTVPPKRKRSTSVNAKPSNEIPPYLATGMIVSAEMNNSKAAEGKSIIEETVRTRSSSWGTWQLQKPQRRRTSSLGDLSEPSTRALLMDFITTLNNAFPDYDFGDTKIEQFKDDTVGYVLQVVNNHFAEVTLRYPDILDQLWSAVDEIINLKVCEVFCFVPDANDEDIHSALWQFHYFFFNKDLNRLCYISCAAKRYVLFKYYLF